MASQKILVAIDDGHGYETQGKRTPMFADGTTMKENEFNEAVTLKLKKYLENANIDVLLVAPETTDVSLQTRVSRANSAKADIYVSIHANAYGSGWNTANGFETLIFPNAGAKTVELAECIHNKCITATGLRNRGIKERPDLYVLRKTSMPAVLLECGFMTNQAEAELLRSDSYRNKVAEAIYEGIIDYFNIKMLGEILFMTVKEAKKIIQEKCGFDDNTMNYLSYYRYGESMIVRLAEAMK